MEKRLDDETESYLEKSPKEKIHYIQKSIFISYTETIDILKRFSDLVDYPQIDRMPNYLLVSDTNNGKSAILREFESKYQVINSPETGPQLKVLYFQAPTKADESRLYSAILEHLNHPHNDSDIASNKLKQVKKLIKALGLKILIIDELHNIAPATANKQREFLVTLKFLCNELRISLICAGTPAIYDVITYDPQLANRFEPIKLKLWTTKPKDFIALIKRYEKRLPLKHASNLAQRELAGKLLKMGEGLLGEYVTILKKAAVFAIESGTEKITLETLNQINYITPSERSLL